MHEQTALLTKPNAVSGFKTKVKRNYSVVKRQLSRDIFFIEYITKKFSPRYPQLQHLHNFSHGASFIINKLWVPAFSGLFLHDVIQFFAYPNARYGTSFDQIIGGIADNQMTFTSHFGNDLAGEWDYSLWPAFIGGAVLTGGIGKALYQARIKPPIKNIVVNQPFEPLEYEDDFKENHFPQKISEKISHLFKTILKNYNSWSGGETVGLKFEIPFWLFLAYVLYADIRLLEIWIIKIIGLNNYLQAKRDCEAANKIFTYMDDFANYECSICPDWPYVLPRDSFTSQGCLDGLLSSGQTPKFILSNLEKILKHPDFKTLDFSNQNWLSWTELQWKDLLSSVSGVINQLETFNLSATLLNPVFPDDGRIEDLVNFANKVKINQLDLRNQGIGSTQANKLSSLIARSHFLDLSSNQLTNANFLVNNTVNLETLILSNNPLGNPGVNLISQQFQNSSLTELDISNIDIGETALPVISNTLQQNKIRKLDISQNDFSQADMGQFGSSTTNSTLEEIDLSQVQIDDQQAIDFISTAKEGTLKKVDLSDNNLTDQGAAGVIAANQNGTVTSINFSGNVITDNGAQGMAAYLPQTSVKEIGLSNTQISKEGFQILATQPTVKSLDISRNPIGDDAAFILSQNKTSLEAINLSATAMTDQGGKQLADAISHSNFKSIKAASNQLTDESFGAISEALPLTEVNDMDFSDNLINLNGAKTLATALPNTKLKSANLANNQIPDEGGVEIAKSLITSTPHINDLDKKHIKIKSQDITRDEIRAERKAKPATQLRKLNLENNPLGELSQRAFKRVLPSTEITFYQNNPSQTFFAQRNVLTPESSNTHNATQYLGLTMISGAMPDIVFGLIVIYLICRIFRSALSSFNQNQSEENQPCKKL